MANRRLFRSRQASQFCSQDLRRLRQELPQVLLLRRLISPVRTLRRRQLLRCRRRELRRLPLPESGQRLLVEWRCLPGPARVRLLDQQNPGNPSIAGPLGDPPGNSPDLLVLLLAWLLQPSRFAGDRILFAVVPIRERRARIVIAAWMKPASAR